MSAHLFSHGRLLFFYFSHGMPAVAYYRWSTPALTARLYEVDMRYSVDTVLQWLKNLFTTTLDKYRVQRPRTSTLSSNLQTFRKKLAGCLLNLSYFY